MRISRGRESGATELRGPTFTGRVWGDAVLSGQDGVSVNLVIFEPGARTHWHHHEVAQVLHVTGGAGWIQTRDGQGGPLTFGDTVHIPAGEDSVMSHLAISIGETVWLDPVSDADYAAASKGR